MITWSFMEEVCDKHLYAGENNLTTDFNVTDFCNMRIFTNYLIRRGARGASGSPGDALVLETLKEYAGSNGLITIKGNVIK